MNQRLLRIILGILIIGACIGIYALVVHFKPEPQQSDRSQAFDSIETVTVHPQSWTFSIASQGHAVAAQRSELTAEVSGKVIDVDPRFEDGLIVDAGTVLMRIDPRDYDLAITRARARLSEAHHALTLEQAASDQAIADWRARHDEAEVPPLVAREPQLQSARDRIAQAQADLDDATLQRERCDITAPYDGRITSTQVDKGQYINRGSPVGSIIAVDRVEIPLPIPANDFALLGMEADFIADDYESAPLVTLTQHRGVDRIEWTGRLMRTRAAVERRSQRAILIAEVRRPLAGDHPLVPGMFVTARIEGRMVDQVFAVPRRAFFPNQDEILVVSDGDDGPILRLRSVERIAREGDTVIVADGLTDGERVCTTVLGIWSDGMRVDLMAADEDEPDHDPADDSSETEQP